MWSDFNSPGGPWVRSEGGRQGVVGVASFFDSTVHEVSIQSGPDVKYNLTLPQAPHFCV